MDEYLLKFKRGKDRRSQRKMLTDSEYQTTLKKVGIEDKNGITLVSIELLKASNITFKSFM